jgi:branched-chain amino acid aminotransferase
MTQSEPRFAFFHGEIVPIATAKVSVMTHALNYGTAVFGGLRGYWNDTEAELFIFRPIDHFKRFIASAHLMRMNIDYSPEDLIAILVRLLKTEEFQTNCYIRPLAYKSSERIGVRLHDLEDNVTMFAVPLGRQLTSEESAHVCFSSWRRVDDNAIPARGKVSGAYANSSLIKSDAVLAGYDEAIVLNQDGHVSEMSAANFFMLRDGVAISPPVNANILEGIVRRSLIRLLRDELDVDVVERNIDRSEVYLADEAFMCGTGVQLVPITRVEHRNIGLGETGPVTNRLRNLFFRVVKGEVEKYRNWLVPVYKHT